MSIERRLVLDANILISAVLGRRVRQIIVNHAADVPFFAPDVAYADAEGYLPALLVKRFPSGALEIDAALDYLSELVAVVRPVPAEVYEAARADALSRIASRDPDDWPVLASALILDCPIWTEDQDFFGAGVSTWTTDRVEIYLTAEHQ